MSKKDWWRGAVIYQIYPRSFMDSNGDGIGDLKGITSRLPYVADLGVDGIWLSPFFKSPMKDFGYDVSDYRAVDPLFGTLADFDELLATAHRLGLKVIIDQVLNHTSDQHVWFKESLQSRDNPKANWYVWADPKPDGTPPNNWPSVFGGPAWTFNARRGQYYMHSFLSSQPDLNFHCPEMQDALFDDCRFWLGKGVDGFRLDAINHCYHDSHLRDNPARPWTQTTSTQLDFPAPYAMQTHIYSKSRPENLALMERIQRLCDEYGAMTLGEIGADNANELAAQYTAPGRLNTCYSFSLLGGRKVKLTAAFIKNAVMDFFREGPDSWPSWAFSNHDVVRSASRFAPEGNPDPRLAKMLIALLCCLRGTPFLYQGEELGLPEAQLAYEDLQDPWGIALWPEWQGRDGCRTPIPWDSSNRHAGFTSAHKTWLPVPPCHIGLNVENQQSDRDSVLSFTQQFLKQRKYLPALIRGDIAFIDTGREDILAFTRTSEGQTVSCAFNLGETDQTYNGDMLPPYGYRLQTKAL
ncbi:MAG: alpha glucosidase [Micavibrio aeruginosavorus]|uniref:Alpha glucosidase n=1 Tax=Micavibrio aeruginosavorus TaxID=349221 RepID=A0A7T5R3V8_9BACT|nr:MAG: alpha glucosidase [Micavibrio aeruginosavorus]